MKQLIATVCFAATLSFEVGMLGAQDANVISAAKREGRVVWYSVAGEQSWGRDKTVAYFRNLAQQQIQFRKGNTLIAQLIVAGEYPLGFVYGHRVELLKSQGAPMDWVSTMNPIITTGGPLGLAAKAAHPNAGTLLIDFVLSKEG